MTTGPAAAVRDNRRAKTRLHQPHTLTGRLRRPRGQVLLFGAWLVIATVALYWPVATHGFLNFDDDIYVTSNPHVQAGLHWSTLKWAFTSFRASNWHPLTWVSHALDCGVFDLDAGRHHEVNLLLHTLTVLLLFWVLQRATGYIGRSAMVAALFAIHPMNVESVAWVAERKNLLSMMFFLLALGAYDRYARQPRIGRYVTVAGLYALGLMAKPQVITLPCVLLLWDHWPLNRVQVSSAVEGKREIATKPFLWLALEKLPLVLLTAASAVVTILAQYESGSMTGPHWQPIGVRVENALVVYVRYIGKAFWPSNLTILYPHPGNALNLWQALASLIVLLVITAIVISMRKQRAYLMVGWFWFLGTLVPMIGIVQVGAQAMADRYAYLPFIGLFIMVCWQGAEWMETWHLPPAWRWGINLVVLIALAAVARRQLNRWADNNLLWWQVVAAETQALQANPTSWANEDALGHVFLKLGDVDSAMPHFQAAAAISPDDPDSMLNLGAYQQRHNDLAGAIRQYQRVIVITQSSPRQNAQNRAQAFSNMGYAYRALKQYRPARESFEQAVQLNPDDTRSWLGLGLMAHKAGDLIMAIHAYTEALKLEPFDWGYLLLAQALDDAGRHDETFAARRRAGAISQNLEQAQQAADTALAK